MPTRPLNVLFLCMGNSARSIIAEALLNSIGRDRFRAFSAGSHPTGKVNPFARELLARHRLSTEGLRSKSWDEFDQPGAPRFDFVITLCDQAAGEACPVWPGRPVTAHWGIDDPAAVQGSEEEQRKSFLKAFNELQSRLLIFVEESATSLADRLQWESHAKRLTSRLISESRGSADT